MNDSSGGHAAHDPPEALRIALAFASAGLEAPATGMVYTLGGRDDGGVNRSIAASCGRDGLPDVDVIVLQPAWSHLSPDDQAMVLDFVSRKLRPGGVFAVHYHCQPGWAPMAPVRALLAHTADAATEAVTGAMAEAGAGAGASTDTGNGNGNGTATTTSASASASIEQALDFADSLLATSPAYFGAYPRVADHLRSLRGAHLPALARDYFSAWQPASFASMADLLGEAKLTFACPADVLDHIAALHLTAPQQALLSELTDPVFAESVRDLMINRSVRADYWVKGARPLAPLQKLEAMRRPAVVLAAPGTHSPAAAGQAANLPSSDALSLALLALMADRQPRTIGALATAVQGPGIALQQVFDAVMVLVGTGKLSLARA